MAEWAHIGDPDAKLWLNDYDILTGNRLADYMDHIRNLLAQGVPVAGIGVQGHLHGETFGVLPALFYSASKFLELNIGRNYTATNPYFQRQLDLNDQPRMHPPTIDLVHAKDLHMHLSY